jgi:hypothetical protein
MRCQDFEHLILESGERELLTEERLALIEHLESCPRCAAFRSFREGLRNCLREATGPELRVEFSDSVRLRCQSEFNSFSRGPAGQGFRRGQAQVPWPIWTAFAFLTGLTLFFLIPGLEQFRQSGQLTLGTALVLTVILQNSLMLFASPLLMRCRRVSYDHSQ